AGAVGAEQPEALAREHLQVEPVDGVHGGRAGRVALAQVAAKDCGCHGGIIGRSALPTASGGAGPGVCSTRRGEGGARVCHGQGTPTGWRALALDLTLFASCPFEYHRSGCATQHTYRAGPWFQPRHGPEAHSCELREGRAK